MPASRKRKCSTPNSAEDQISRGKRKKDSQTTAKKATRRKTRRKKKETTKDAAECGVMSVTVTLKRSVVSPIKYFWDYSSCHGSSNSRHH